MFEAWIALPRIAILGGSFNPPHIGHLRLAIEAYETLMPKKVIFIPTAKPPHKSAQNLLPFGIRAALLRACVRDMPNFYLSEIEAKRDEPSYTVNTLEALHLEYPTYRLCFILGVTDFSEFMTWHRWQDITVIADLIVVSRKNEDVTLFTTTVKSLWPDAGEAGCYLAGLTKVFVMTDGGSAMFMPIPRLDVSSSDLRRRWLAGTSIKYLVPPKVEALLADNIDVVAQNWRKES